MAIRLDYSVINSLISNEPEWNRFGYFCISTYDQPTRYHDIFAIA